MHRIRLIILLFFLLPVLLFLFLVIYASVTDYRPAEKEWIYQSQTPVDSIGTDIPFSILTWNIGYAGLDKKMDFFYDGGKKVRTPKSQLKKNLQGIRNYLSQLDSLNFMNLQEVDISGKRSYNINEVKQLSDLWGNKNVFFAKNYKVFFVPVPLRDPMGGVNSGILTMSRFKPAHVQRVSFPGQYAWPKRLFMLDRCFMVLRFPVISGKEFLLINTHNEAYDKGNIRDQQMAYLKTYLQAEYAKGNYILVAGDWNQCPPGLVPHFAGEPFDSINFKGIQSDYLPAGWQWVFDDSIPSNRRVDIPYKRGKTLTTVIDFFLLSPNIRSMGCKTTDLGFEFSDHQPVELSFELN